MTTTMNGEKRLWPPPENWVRGEDGRWRPPDNRPEGRLADEDSDKLPVWDWTFIDDDLSLTEQTVETGIELRPEPVPELLLEHDGQPEQRSHRDVTGGSPER